MTSFYLLAHFTVLNLLQKLLHYLCECVLHRIMMKWGRVGGGGEEILDGHSHLFVDDAYLTRRELSRNKK